MTIQRDTPVFDSLTRLVGTLAGSYDLRATNVDAHTRDKVRWLKGTGRDLLAVSPTVRNAILSEFRSASLRILTGGGNIRVEQALNVAAQKAGEFVVLRLVQQRGYGAPWRALAPATVERKRHDKRPSVRANATKVGIATGAMLEDLEATRWEFVKTSG